MFAIKKQTVATKTRLMHQCNRKADCKCIDLLVFFFTLLHLTEETSQISQKLEAVQIHEPKKRMPFKAFLTWVQLEMYLGRLTDAESLINGYIKDSSHLGDPAPPKPLNSQIQEEDEGEEKEEKKGQLF